MNRTGDKLTVLAGTVILPDGAVLLPDGTVILPDGNEVELTPGMFVSPVEMADGSMKRLGDCTREDLEEAAELLKQRRARLKAHKAKLA